MSMPWRHRLRLLRRGAWYALAISLVLAALLVTLTNQLLPVLEQHPEHIATWLSERAQRKVAFDKVNATWTRRGPLLRLENLRIGDGPQPLSIGDAELLVAPYAGLLPGRSLTELRLRGLDLTLQRTANGQWQVRGLPGQKTDSDPLQTLSHLGELQLAQARLQVLAPELGVAVRLPRIDLRLRVDGAHVQAGARAWLRENAEPLDIAGELDRSSGNGRVYVGSQQVELAELANLLRIAGISPLAGHGQVQAWARLQGYRIVALRAAANLQEVRLRGVPPAQGQPAQARSIGDLELDAAWAGSIRDWQAHATRLRIGSGDHKQTLDGVTVIGGQHYGLRAQRVDTAPLLQLLTLTDALPEGMRRWLLLAAPGAVLSGVELLGERGGKLRARARISGFRFNPVEDAPGMRGVAGWLMADQDGLRMRFDRNAQVVFDWPAGFGVVHAFKMDGEVVLWRDGAGWTAQTPGLAIDGGQLQLHARGGIGFQGDGSHPLLNIAADIGDAPITMAHGFWIHHLMPKATVQWLDAALQSGTLRNTHAVVAGDLDDWPFRNEPGMAGAGVFRADTHIDNGSIKFQPEWPAAEHMDADVSFVADGFTVNGRAQLAGVPVTYLQAGIARFHEAELKVDAEANGDAKNFLVMLRASPLHKDYGSTLNALRAAGPARAEYHMLLPLHHDVAVPPTIDGVVNLAGVHMQETRFKLDFDQVRGQARFDQGGFDAPVLQVRQAGAPGVLALRAGPHVRDPAQAFEAQLQTRIGIDDLLAKAGNLDWLQPYLQGSSMWSAELAIARGAASGSMPGQLRLRSNLVGTAFDLPEPLQKSSAQALPASIEIGLPLESGDIIATLGDVLSLHSRSAKGKTGLRVQLGGGLAEAPPASGLWVSGQADQLDALDWMSVAAGGRGTSSLPLQRFDVQAKRLRMLGTEFAETRVQMTPGARSTSVLLQGTGIAGALQVPDAKGAAITGRLERLYWSLPVAAGSETGGAATFASGRFDPASIPPLSFDVADLRLGSVAMGRARFRTTPVAGGLRMDDFSTSGGKQRIHGSGNWSGRGVSERSQFKLDVDSDDAGALLAGFGFGGQIGGGRGKLGIEASWHGGPEAFDPKQLDAALALDVRDGHLLEIEPGAGRVLGLLGVAQLRRRLTLDFSDFFSKGFAFDRIQGNARLAQGMLHTDNLTVRGPAADILIRGDTDLRNQRFDQNVDVQPKSAGVLTAVGALAAGPVGAAVGAVANAVLDRPMRDIGAKHYRVTGPWAAPKVEVVAKHSAPATVPSAEGD